MGLGVTIIFIHKTQISDPARVKHGPTGLVQTQGYCLVSARSTSLLPLPLHFLPPRPVRQRPRHLPS